jgi:signal transduction histidine kinase
MYIYLTVMFFSVFLATYAFWCAQKRAALKANSRQSVSRRYQELFDNSEDAIFVVEVLRDGKYRLESLNAVAEKSIDPHKDGLPGYRFDEIGRLTLNYLRQSILRDLSARLRTAVETGMPVRYEGSFSVMPETLDHIFDFNLIPMADDGGITHILCFARDITPHKRYAQELLERTRLEERLSRFAASAPGFFYSYRHGTDGSNSMPFASEGIYFLFGLQPGDVAESIAPLNLCIHADDMGKVIATIAASAADLSPLSIEFRAQHPLFGEQWIESRAVPELDKNDGSIVWHGFMHDISARKKMEEALVQSSQNLAEAQRIGQMGSWELDLASGAMTCSEEIYRIFEITPDIAGSSFDALLNAVHPDDVEAVKKIYFESLENPRSYNIDHRLLFPDGRVKHVRQCCEVHKESHGKLQHLHGTVQDISAIKVTEQQLKDTQDKLRELMISRELLRENERKRIAWEMHEELGQLLAAAKMRLTGLRTQLPDAPRLVQESRIIDDLLDKSIRNVHDIVSDLRPTVLLHGAVAALEWLVAECNKHPGIECELKIEGDEDSYVSDELTTLVFRLAQEMLEDVVRHDGVTRILVTWHCDADEYRLSLQHNGDGSITDLAEDKSLNMLGMHERAAGFGGEISVFNTLARHTVIEARFENA